MRGKKIHEGAERISPAVDTAGLNVMVLIKLLIASEVDS